MTPSELAERLDAQPVGKGQWQACCPAHDDAQASLSIGVGEDGKVLLNCHAGCNTEDVLREVGLRSRDLFRTTVCPPTGIDRDDPRDHIGRLDGDAVAALSAKLRVSPSLPPNGSPKPLGFTKPPIQMKPVTLDQMVKQTAGRVRGSESGRWLYHDDSSIEVGCVVRYETPKGKTYRPFRKDGAVWCEGGSAGKRPLYRLPSIVAGEGPVYVVEGEKAADAACELGLTATTSMHGAKSASKTDWSSLAGREVVILPDHDSAGMGYATEVSRILAELSPSISVKVVELPDLPEHGDVVEYITAHKDEKVSDIRASIERLVSAAPCVDLTEQRAGPVLVSLADVNPEPVEWLWPDRIPLGKLTMIAGDPGLGKSFTTLDMAARVSTGSAWPDQASMPVKSGGVLLINVEDDNADTVVPRLIAAGADLSRITAFNSVKRFGKDKLTEGMFTLEADMIELEQAIVKVPGIRLIIIDPVSAFMGKTDSHSNTDVRGLLAPLAALAAKYRVAVVCISHLNKNAACSPIYRTIGSIAQVAAARAAYGVVKDKDDPLRRLFLPMKNNLAPDEHGLAYRVMDGEGTSAARVVWEPVPVDISATDAFAPDRPGPNATDRDSAEAWLRRVLADGPRLTKEIEDEAINGESMSKRTLERARRALGVESYRPENPGPWWLRLSEHTATPLCPQ